MPHRSIYVEMFHGVDEHQLRARRLQRLLLRISTHKSGVGMASRPVMCDFCAFPVLTFLHNPCPDVLLDVCSHAKAWVNCEDGLTNCLLFCPGQRQRCKSNAAVHIKIFKSLRRLEAIITNLSSKCLKSKQACPLRPRLVLHQCTTSGSGLVISLFLFSRSLSLR